MHPPRSDDGGLSRLYVVFGDRDTAELRLGTESTDAVKQRLKNPAVFQQLDRINTALTAAYQAAVVADKESNG